MTIHLTPKRLAWLRRLAIGPTDRHSNVGYWCMHAGWSEWNYVNAKGEEMTGQEAKERYGETYFEHVRVQGERLTARGRAIVEAHVDDPGEDAPQRRVLDWTG